MTTTQLTFPSPLHVIAATWVDRVVERDGDRIADAADTADIYSCGHTGGPWAYWSAPEPCDCDGNPRAQAAIRLENDVRAELRARLGDSWHTADPATVPGPLRAALGASRAAWERILGSGELHPVGDC